MRGYLLKPKEDILFFKEEDCDFYQFVRSHTFAGIFLFSNILKNNKGVNWNKARIESLIELGIIQYIDGEYECIHIVGVDNWGGGEEWDQVFLECVQDEDFGPLAFETFLPFENCPICNERILENTLEIIRKKFPDFTIRKAS